MDPMSNVSQPWSLAAGAQLQADNSVRFTVWAPHTTGLRVRLGTGQARGEHTMTLETVADGAYQVYTAVVPGAVAGDDYVFVLNDGRALPDPVSRWQPHGVHGPSRIVDPAFDWTDDMWRGNRMDEIVLYELHVGTFAPEGTFAAIIPRLPELKALGVTSIELMPVAQFPGDRNWGYDGVGMFAVQDSYGGPTELRRLVDAAHALRIGVILDVVYNHAGPEGNYLPAFGPYFTDRYKTPWGSAFNFDGPHADPVRQFVIDNACHWVTEYHIDGLRLDAVHGIIDTSALNILEELAAAVHARATELQKSIVVIAESDLNDPRLVRPVAEHGYGLDAQWSDDFHHAIHSALVGETNGYYADFGNASFIGAAMREPFVYDGRFSAHRGRRHGRPSVGIPSERFVVALQNHDQVGNRANGERLATLLSPGKLRLAAALLLLSPYIPLIFMGEEYGETNPFQYFVSHGDDELVEAVRRGRRREFTDFMALDEIPDPQDRATFERSRIDWDKRAGDMHDRILSLYRDLLAIRRDESLMRPDRAYITVESGDPGWISILRETADEWSDWEHPLLALFNCTDGDLAVPVPESTTCAWTMRLGTDAAAYGGNAQLGGFIERREVDDAPRRLVGAEPPRTVRMPAWTAALYAAVPER